MPTNTYCCRHWPNVSCLGGSKDNMCCDVHVVHCDEISRIIANLPNISHLASIGLLQS